MRMRMLDRLHSVKTAIAGYFSVSQEDSFTPVELVGSSDLLLHHTSVRPALIFEVQTCEENINY
jgi:hypothetical protein